MSSRNAELFSFQTLEWIKMYLNSAFSEENKVLVVTTGHPPMSNLMFGEEWKKVQVLSTAEYPQKKTT